MDLENINDGTTPMSYMEFLNKGNEYNIERNKYTDEEYRKMAKKLDKIINKREILGAIDYKDKISEAAVILGAPDIMAKDEDYKDIMWDFYYSKDENGKSLLDSVNQSLQGTNPSDIDRYEMMLRVLNGNLVIKDNYIAGPNDRTTMMLSNKGFFEKTQRIEEIFVDEKGLIHDNRLYCKSYPNGEQTVSKHSNIEKKDMIGKTKTLYKKSCYKRNIINDRANSEGKSDITFEEAMQLMSIPDNEFDEVYNKGNDNNKDITENSIDYSSDIEENNINYESKDSGENNIGYESKDSEENNMGYESEVTEGKDGNIIDKFTSVWEEKSAQKEQEKAQKNQEKKEAIMGSVEGVMSMFSKGKDDEKGAKSEGAITSADVLNGANIQSIAYTDKEYDNLANKVAKNSGKNMDRVEIIEQSLMQLGVPQELLESSDYKPMIYGMVNQYLYEDNGKGAAIFSQDKQGCEQVLRTLNENLVIRDNYIAGITKLDTNGRNYSEAERMTEFFVDENGVILESKEQWDKNTNKNVDISKSFAACNLDEQGKRNVLSYKEVKGENNHSVGYENTNFDNMNINKVRENLGREGTNSAITRNEVYKEASSKNRQLGEQVAVNENNSRNEGQKEQEKQKSSGLFSIFGKAYDSQDITGNDLNSIMGIIKESLNKDKNRDQQEQNNQR